MSGNMYQDTSFSSYPNGAEDTFVLELQPGGEHARLKSSIYLAKNRAAEDREIEVFDAEKYFNQGANPRKMAANLESSPIHRKEDSAEGQDVRDRSRMKTPSIRSEARCDSRIALLHGISVNERLPRRTGWSFLASIGCKCSCRDKNSLEIRDFAHDGKNRDPSFKKSLSDYENLQKFQDRERRVNSDGHFSFPVYNPGNHGENTPKRKSLDVFGSSALEKVKNCLRLEKKLTMLTWDAPVPGVGEEIRIPSFSSDLNNDSDSDDDSDLFEIENLSKGDALLSRQASDDMSDYVSTVNCYAPSEASIAWSVVTASAADFSVFSDFEELRSGTGTTTTTTAGTTVSGTASTIQDHLKLGLKSKNVPLKESSERRQGILSGCKSQKAVRVAREAHRASNKGISNSRNLQKSEKTCTQTAQTHNDRKVKVDGFAARKGQQKFDELVLSKPHSRAATRLLYT